MTAISKHILFGLFIVMFSISGFVTSSGVMAYLEPDEEYEPFAQSYYASLILQQPEKYDIEDTRIGVAEYQDFGVLIDGENNAQLEIKIQRQDIDFEGPFFVYINESKIGIMEEIIIEKMDFSYVFHKLRLDTKNGDIVPAIAQGDTIQLINPDFIYILGEFVPAF